VDFSLAQALTSAEKTEIDQFAFKAGALNLAIQFDKENVSMKSDILQCLHSFINL